MINNEKLDKILEHDNFPAVSIFIPTEITGDYEVNRIRWKNQLSEVYKTLADEGYEKTSFLKSAENLLDDSTFWANQSSGLAGYFSPGVSEIVNLNDTPISSNLISNTFVATPLLLSKMNSQRVFLLTLSQNDVRFFEAVNSGIFPVRIEDLLPAVDIKLALNLDIQKETLHPTGQGLSNTNHFKDKSNVRIEQFFKLIDDGLWTLLEGEKVPLVIAAVEEHHSVYRNVSRYKYISPHMLMGNTDTMSPAELRLQLDPVFEDLQAQNNDHISKKLNEDFEKKRVVKNEKDLLFNLEIDNVDTFIIPTDFSNEDKAQVMQLEQILRTCYDRNINVALRDDFSALSAITRNEIVKQKETSQ